MSAFRRRLTYKRGQVTTSLMTALEVIDQIKALPPEERANVIEFIHAAKTGATAHLNGAFAEAASWVFEEHRELMRKLSQ